MTPPTKPMPQGAVGSPQEHRVASGFEVRNTVVESTTGEGPAFSKWPFKWAPPEFHNLQPGSIASTKAFLSQDICKIIVAVGR